MAKRGASSELNDRNWEEEEEPEEAGMFVQAASDVLEQRVIKRAKRRVVEDNDFRPKAFSGFSGLSGKKTTSSSDTLSGLSGKKTTSSINTFSGFKKLSGDSAPNTKPSIFAGSSSVNGNEDQKVKNPGERESSTYLSSLKSLNESVLAWVKQHVERNPYIILTPVFRDYEKHLESVQMEKFSSPTLSSVWEGGNNNNVCVDSAASMPSKLGEAVCVSASSSEVDDNPGKQPEAPKAKAFSFSKTLAAAAVTTTATAASASEGFSFISSSAGSNTGSTLKFTSASSLPSAGFFFNQTSTATSSFGKPSLFSLGSTNSSQGSFSLAKTDSSQEPSSSGGTQETDDNENEEYKPPQPEVKEIVEEDALYTKRCKLYYKKDDQWIDRGVGNLHLKPVPENKTQILVRADTNLGNILLNVMLSSSMPLARQGKNNVFLVCVPNPPINSGDGEGAATPMLIKVKTEEDADELFTKIDERKKLL